MDLTGSQSKYPGMIIRRCGNCGTTLGYPTLQVQYVYRNCTYCNRETRDDNKMVDPAHTHARSLRRGRRGGGRRPRAGKGGRRGDRASIHGRTGAAGADLGFKKDSVSEQEAAALGLEPVKILAGAWGHSRDPSKAFDITADLQRMQAASPTGDLQILRDEFGDPSERWGDPCPGSRKVLSIRAVYCNRKWETKVFQRRATSRRRPNLLERDIVYRKPENPWLKLVRLNSFSSGGPVYLLLPSSCFVYPCMN